ncbi:C40 family peptidase [Antribacter gilvus]|uniref:C40 family peptidase n=1 Tax=Antribacter gilvus TaxID=2304675 RepID=UPI000F7AB154|nr:C40 family peptidase [Antribacter gilvus]
MEPSFTSTTPSRGRHRAVRRPILATVAQAATEHVSAFAGRTAVVAAAGSGVLLTLVATPAQAAPASTAVNTSLAGKPIQGTLDSASLNALTSQARQAVAAAAVVTVAPDAELKVETTAVSVTSAAENEEYRAQVAAEEAAERGSAVVSIGMRYLGVPYLWGGSTPAGMDCSGFTSYVYAQVGINLPRTSSEQRYAGPEVPASQAQPGDLIWSPGHIAIYAGDGMQIEAPVPGQTVRYTSIWQSNPTFIRVG